VPWILAVRFAVLSLVFLATLVGCTRGPDIPCPAGYVANDGYRSRVRGIQASDVKEVVMSGYFLDSSSNPGLPQVVTERNRIRKLLEAFQGSCRAETIAEEPGDKEGPYESIEIRLRTGRTVELTVALEVAETSHGPKVAELLWSSSPRRSEGIGDRSWRELQNRAARGEGVAANPVGTPKIRTSHNRIRNVTVRARAAQIQASQVRRVGVSFSTVELGSSKDPAVIEATLTALIRSDRTERLAAEPGAMENEPGRIDLELKDGKTVSFRFHVDDLQECWGDRVTVALEQIVPDLKEEWAKAENRS